MNGQIDQLVKSLLQKDSLEQCSLKELEQFASRHPYFGAAQLLLTKKMQVENSSQYDEQLQKTFLFFHNPLWVQQLLNDTGKANITVAEKKEEIREIVPIEETTEQVIVADPEESVETDQPVFTIPVIEEAPPAEEIAQPLVDPEPTMPEETEQPVFTTAFIEEDNPEKEIIAEHVSNEPIEASVEIVETPAIPELKKEVVEPAKDVLLFEPFHTVDYFASLGIKIREDEKSKDKFSLQLRSFTDWLKSMKKLPVTEITAKVEPAAEKKVEQMAAHSLEEREVLTEAMAEVWEKQGNSEKAIEVYNKLSLLDPSKSVYFAAKIEELKK